MAAPDGTAAPFVIVFSASTLPIHENQPSHSCEEDEEAREGYRKRASTALRSFVICVVARLVPAASIN
jgi:hypothetical protein